MKSVPKKKPDQPAKPTECQLHVKRLVLAVEHIGMCLRDLAMVLQQGGPNDYNKAKLAGVAAGLERARCAVMNQSYAPEGLDDKTNKKPAE